MPGRTGAGGDGVAPARDVDDVMDGWAEKAARAYGLTPRERQILFLLLRGDDGPAIAEELGLSNNTVRSHKKRLYRKLDVHSKQELLELMRSL
jgi:DNA-binding CsgD family transcriptional regulator